MQTSFRVDHSFDFDGVSYLSIRQRKLSAFSSVRLQHIVMKWPDDHDVNLITEWLKKEHVYRALGFSRSLPQKYVRRSVVPDLTGTMEAVEFLIFKDTKLDTPTGFLICYEAKRVGDANQEVDFAIMHEGHRGNVALIRTMKLCMLTYLFAVRGAKSVCWIRRKRLETEAEPSAGASGRYRQQGGLHVVTLERFITMLQIEERTTDPDHMPTVVLEAGPRSYPPSLQDDEGSEDD